MAGTQLGGLRILHNQSLSYDLTWIRVARECWYKRRRTEDLCDTRLTLQMTGQERTTCWDAELSVGLGAVGKHPLG